MSDNEFEVGDSGAANITLVEAGRRKPGSLLMMKGEFPCKVVSFSTAKPGKHGSAKAMITGKDIFTDKQYEETFGTGDMIQAPVVTKTEYNCLDVTAEGALQLLVRRIVGLERQIVAEQDETEGLVAQPSHDLRQTRKTALVHLHEPEPLRRIAVQQAVDQ